MPLCNVALHNFILLVLRLLQTGDQDNLNYHRNFRGGDWKIGQEEERKLDLVCFYYVVRSQWTCPYVSHSPCSKSSLKQIGIYKMLIVLTCITRG